MKMLFHYNGLIQVVLVVQPNKQFIPGGLFPGRLIYITATPGPTKYLILLRTVWYFVHMWHRFSIILSWNQFIVSYTVVFLAAITCNYI